MEGCCWLCGRNGSEDPLDTHHIFGGAYRSKSEKYGLTVQLCHEKCHIFGKYAAHANAETMRWLKEYGQREAMRRFGWTVEEFRREFGKNYLDECGVWSVECGDEVSPEATDQKDNPSGASRQLPLHKGALPETCGGYGVEENGQMSIIFAPMPYFYVTAEELPF